MVCVVGALPTQNAGHSPWFVFVLPSGLLLLGTPLTIRLLLEPGQRAGGGGDKGGLQPAQLPIRQLLGATDAQTAHPAASSAAPAHQRLGSANAETTPARAPAAAADRTQRPDATCEGKTG